MGSVARRGGAVGSGRERGKMKKQVGILRGRNRNFTYAAWPLGNHIFAYVIYKIHGELDMMSACFILARIDHIFVRFCMKIICGLVIFES